MVIWLDCYRIFYAGKEIKLTSWLGWYCNWDQVSFTFKIQFRHHSCPNLFFSWITATIMIGIYFLLLLNRSSLNLFYLKERCNQCVTWKLFLSFLFVVQPRLFRRDIVQSPSFLNTSIKFKILERLISISIDYWWWLWMKKKMFWIGETIQWWDFNVHDFQNIISINILHAFYIHVVICDNDED